MAALKLQAAGNTSGEGKEADAGQRPSLTAQNDAVWEAKLEGQAKASEEKLANLAARHNETVEVRWCMNLAHACMLRISGPRIDAVEPRKRAPCVSIPRTTLDQ